MFNITSKIQGILFVKMYDEGTRPNIAIDRSHKARFNAR